MSFEVVRNNIVKVRADAIVNSADHTVIVGKGTDGAIYAAAGKEKLLAARKAIGAINFGDAKITKAFDLDAKFIIHTVAPVFHHNASGEFEEILRSCYRKSLDLALENDCKSIAFPVLAAGVNDFPKKDALLIAISEIQKFLLDHDDCDLQVMLVVFDEEIFELSKKIFPNVREEIDDESVKAAESQEYEGGVEQHRKTQKLRFPIERFQIKKIVDELDNSESSATSEKVNEFSQESSNVQNRTDDPTSKLNVAPKVGAIPADEKDPEFKEDAASTTIATPEEKNPPVQESSNVQNKNDNPIGEPISDSKPEGEYASKELDGRKISKGVSPDITTLSNSSEEAGTIQKSSALKTDAASEQKNIPKQKKIKGKIKSTDSQKDDRNSNPNERDNVNGLIGVSTGRARKDTDKNYPNPPAIYEHLANLISGKNMTEPQTYYAAQVSSKVFSEIRTKGKPSKKTAIALALALKLSLEETKDLLKEIGITLTDNLAFEAVILYCIEEGIYEIDEVNSKLVEANQQPLREDFSVGEFCRRYNCNQEKVHNQEGNQILDSCKIGSLEVCGSEFIFYNADATLSKDFAYSEFEFKLTAECKPADPTYEKKGRATQLRQVTVTHKIPKYGEITVTDELLKLYVIVAHSFKSGREISDDKYIKDLKTFIKQLINKSLKENLHAETKAGRKYSVGIDKKQHTMTMKIERILT